MGKFIDLTGQKFGRLTVINKTDKRNANGAVIWHCRCDCGKEIDVAGTPLRNGHTKSCGCYNIELSTQRLVQHNFKDLTGKRFGKLTVIKKDGTVYQPNGVARITWLCRCDCGTEKIIRGADLNAGKIKSCGCLKTSFGEYKIQKLLEENNIPFEKEKIFDTCILPSGRHARFDFYIDNKYLIEFDGKQHFLEDAGWGEPIEIVKNRDQYKNEWCKQNHISLIRIPYTAENTFTLNDLLENSQYKI